MPHTVRALIVEPDPGLKLTLQARYGGSTPPVRIVASLAEAEEAAEEAASPLMVVARGDAGDAESAARIACAFNLQDMRVPLRLVVLSAAARPPFASPTLGAYLREIDHCLARASLAHALGLAKARVTVPGDFPNDLYAALAHVGTVDGADILLARNRITERKQLLVQTRDGEPAAALVWKAIYREMRERSPGEMLRHELAAHHSYLASPSLPDDLARKVAEQATARAA